MKNRVDMAIQATTVGAGVVGLIIYAVYLFM